MCVLICACTHVYTYVCMCTFMFTQCTCAYLCVHVRMCALMCMHAGGPEFYKRAGTLVCVHMCAHMCAYEEAWDREQLVVFFNCYLFLYWIFYLFTLEILSPFPVSPLEMPYSILLAPASMRVPTCLGPDSLSWFTACSSSCPFSSLCLSWFRLVFKPCSSWILSFTCFLPYIYNKNSPYFKSSHAFPLFFHSSHWVRLSRDA